MQVLNLPACEFKIKNRENKSVIFDMIRKKYVRLTPEEWVRQHVIHFLINEKKYPSSLMAVEKKMTFNKLVKRTDILVFNQKGLPEIIVECKAPTVKITQASFDQIARYNLKLNAHYLFVTNGMAHYYCMIDPQNECYHFLKELPKYGTNS
ncbi:MAG: type I restriction enzyme HsdR N-terminal domain-containing protein [Lutibacter sp.]|jgi:type I site-specific restriction endonuclease|nr:type I restriction enzyme HsdR N-terminal domain-containing protein [Lutibacter sp.]